MASEVEAEQSWRDREDRGDQPVCLSQHNTTVSVSVSLGRSDLMVSCDRALLGLAVFTVQSMLGLIIQYQSETFLAFSNLLASQLSAAQ